MERDSRYERFFETMQARFLEHGDPLRSAGQVRYMRNQFDFFGLSSPQVRTLAREHFRSVGPLPESAWADFLSYCYEQPQREWQYLALHFVEWSLKGQAEGFVDRLEWLVTQKSWWDTVDWLAKLVGVHFGRFPALVAPVTRRWMDSGNCWLQRVCLIFQLHYRERTDFDLMARYILELQDTQEFFLRKGAGWALRQYARSQPEVVRAFVARNPGLSALTRREAMKHLSG
ncbi:MAG: hypothetical protein RLY31_1976 [Bacteroidota bacterium]|jgi:3-methyladenine DNA glycosylase AlkD